MESPFRPRRCAAGTRRSPAPAGVAVLLGLTLLAGSPAARAGEDPPPAEAPKEEPPAEPRPPASSRQVFSTGSAGEALEIAAGPGSVIGRDELILKEYVDIRIGRTRLQADTVRYVPATHRAEAWGNVVMDFGGARITADHLEYNLESGTGTFYQARGFADPSYYFEAARIEKISEDELVLYDATFSACTQPIPYWSFKLGRGLLRLDDYAYLHDLSFRIGRVPIFYSPYLVWPIKSDRSTGLLFPEFGFSQRNGTVISNAIYWPMRRNMDATFYLDYMSDAGYGSGLEYRYIPSVTGRGYFTGYYIRDRIAKAEQDPLVSPDRWVINYGHNQEFGPGWRLVANANFISDFDYYLDFERDLRLSTTPQALSNLNLTRNWSFYSLNMSGERREQLVNNVIPATDSFGTTVEQVTVTRWIQPEVELRGTRRRLGKSPLFLSFESSAASFDKGTGDTAYHRLDAFPVLSSQLSPVPWFDVDVNAGVRETYYTKSADGDAGCDNIPGTGDPGEGNGVADSEGDEDGDGIFNLATEDDGCDDIDGSGDPGEGNGRRDFERGLVLDQSLNRLFAQGGVAFIGPKIHRIYDTPDSEFSPQLKHTFEPQVRYTYRSDVDNPTRVIPFDEVDAIPTRQSRFTYALVTRLYAKRPVDTASPFGVMPGVAGGPAPAGGGAAAPFGGPLIRPQGYGDEPVDETGAEAPQAGGGGKKQLSTVEIATFEISQDYSLLRPLSLRSTSGSTTGSPVLEESNLSAVRASVRLNPSAHASFDVRTSFDILFRQIREASLSANLRSVDRGFVDLTWSLVRSLEVQVDRSQVGLIGETNFLNRRLLVGLQINYELGDVGAGDPRLRDQRYKVGYNTQCCGFQIEYLNRNFVGSTQNEFRFLINLRGVGNVVDLHSGTGGALPGTFPTF